MPQVAASEFETLSLEAFAVSEAFPLHDVWRVDLGDTPDLTLPRLRTLLLEQDPRSLPLLVRALFDLREALGRLFRWDERPAAPSTRAPATPVPERLREASLLEPGTLDGPFQLLFGHEREAVYEIRNATVHALLVVALVDAGSGTQLYWASYVRAVGRITRLYMALIDPFRRIIVYPGLEGWLRRRLAATGAGPPL